MSDGRFRTVAGLLGMLLSSACGYDNGPDSGATVGMGPQDSQIYSASIDAGATMTDLTPGNGIGMFIEYQSGGTWDVRFTCDTSVSNLACPWHMDAQTLDQTSITDINTQLLDSSDAVSQPSSDLLLYDGTTTTEVDEFSFKTTAGHLIGFDIALDYVDDPHRYVFWIGDGGLNRGVPGPSFNLVPNSP